MTLADFGYPVRVLSKDFSNYLAFQPFDFERAW
jgi:hypothetical protein